MRWTGLSDVSGLFFHAIKHSLSSHGTPNASDEELLEEGCCNEFVVPRFDVSRNESTSKDASNHKGKPSARVTADETNGGAANECANLSNDGDDRDLRIAHSHLVLQERWKQILTAMGDTVHSGHQNYHVDEQDPVLAKSFVELLEERLESAAFRVS